MIVCTEKRTISLLSILLGLIVGNSLAVDVHLIWDPSPTTNVTYTIYSTTNDLPSTNLHSWEVRVSAGTNQAIVMSDMRPGRFTFAATAVRESYSVDISRLAVNLESNDPIVITNKVESDPSNFLVLEIPKPPAMLVTLVVQANTTLTGTNWSDVGFFKIAIPKVQFNE